MTEPEYRAADAVNWSSLKYLRDGSPLHYRHALANPRKDTPGLMLGRALHKLVLEPDTFAQDFAVFDGDGTRASAAYKAFAAANEGRSVLKADELADTRNAAAALRAYPPAVEYLTAPDAIAERPIFWTDKRTGMLCKAKPDLVVPSLRAVVDVKSTATADPHRFGLVAGRMGYPLQMEHYAAGVEAVYGFEPERIVFLVVETDPPHDCAVLAMDLLHRRQARKDLDALLERLAECRRTDTWPGRYPSASYIQLPDYLLDDMTADFSALEGSNE